MNLRYWLIKQLCGNRTVIINATLQGAIVVRHNNGTFAYGLTWERRACDKCGHAGELDVIHHAND